MKVLNHYHCPTCRFLFSETGQAWDIAECHNCGTEVVPDTYDGEDDDE